MKAILDGEVLAEKLKDLEEVLKEQAYWHGDDAREVKFGRRLLEEFREGITLAAAAWKSTSEAHAATGWNEQTLQARARAKLAGEQLPDEWQALQVRRSGTGYVFLISSIPPKA